MRISRIRFFAKLIPQQSFGIDTDIYPWPCQWLNFEKFIDEAMTAEEKQACTMMQDMPGIDEVSSKLIVSVLGTDVSRFPDDNHISSWAGLCPGNHQSAGKRRSSKTTKGNNLLRSTLVIGAHSAVKDKSTFYHAQYERIRKRRGNKLSIVAAAHSMLIAIYHMLKYEEDYKELGSDYYDRYVITKHNFRLISAN